MGSNFLGEREMQTYTTRNGGTLEIIRNGALTDMHVKDGAGETVATVVKPHAEVVPLILALTK
jgi:hypothetical protein